MSLRLTRPWKAAIAGAAGVVVIGSAVALWAGPGDEPSSAAPTSSAPGTAGVSTNAPSTTSPVSEGPAGTTTTIRVHTTQPTSPSTTTKYESAFQQPASGEVLVASGLVPDRDAEWRLYASRREGELCLKAVIAGSQAGFTGASGGGRCGFEALDAAGAEHPGSNVELWYGTAPAAATLVVVQGSFGERRVETFDLPHPFAGRGFVSESQLEADPTTFIALDANGDEIARHRRRGA